MANTNDTKNTSKLDDVIDVHATDDAHNPENFNYHVASDLPEMMLDWEAALKEMPKEDKDLLGM